MYDRRRRLRVSGSLCVFGALFFLAFVFADHGRARWTDLVWTVVLLPIGVYALLKARRPRSGR